MSTLTLSSDLISTKAKRRLKAKSILPALPRYPLSTEKNSSPKIFDISPRFISSIMKT